MKKVEEEVMETNMDFGLVYVEPILHSKYRLAANILYLLMYDADKMNPKVSSILFPTLIK